LSDLRLRVEETSDLKKIGENSEKGGYNPYRTKKQGKSAKKETKIRIGLGQTPVGRGDSGAKASPLAARPYVARSPGSPLPHLLDGHSKHVGCSAIPARSCPGPVLYPWKYRRDGSASRRNARIDDTSKASSSSPNNQLSLTSLGPSSSSPNNQLSLIFLFLSFVANTQLNHWTEQVVRTHLIAQDPRGCSGPLATCFMADPSGYKQSTMFVGWPRANSPNNELSQTGARQAEGL